MDKEIFNFDNTYINLPNELYSKETPRKTKDPELILLNKKLCDKLSIDYKLLEKNGGNILSGNQTNQDMALIAQSYSGHQYGYFTNLGDGRALLLGEHLTESDMRFDIQLKGSGQTKYSRRGDGRATLSSVLREYIISEAMYYLNIPTTRSLAVVEDKEKIKRHSFQRSGILTRVAKSHIRIGTFEFAKTKGISTLKKLADYTINRHFKKCKSSDNPYLCFFKKVIDKQAKLITKWQSIGFIHGVMNTDNVSISGQTIDYGPCAFMNSYDSKTVFSSIDRYGRYAYSNQGKITHWNLEVLGNALLPLIDKNESKAKIEINKALKTFNIKYKAYYEDNFTNKIGIKNQRPDDINLVNELLEIMENNKMDFTNTFSSLDVKKNFENTHLSKWSRKWKERLNESEMTKDEINEFLKMTNPQIIPRNYIVEKVLKSSENENYKPLEEFLKVLKDPYNKNIDEKYKKPPSNTQEVKQTFCNT